MAPNIPEQYKKAWKPPFQRQETAPGQQRKLNPPPLDDITADGKSYKPAGKLEGRKAIITGADSGIGRSVALLFGKYTPLIVRSSVTSNAFEPALEGADLTLTYHPSEKTDVEDMVDLIKRKTNNTRKIQTLQYDLRKEEACKDLIQKHLDFHGKLDTLYAFFHIHTCAFFANRPGQIAFSTTAHKTRTRTSPASRQSNGTRPSTPTSTRSSTSARCVQIGRAHV